MLKVSILQLVNVLHNEFFFFFCGCLVVVFYRSVLHPKNGTADYCTPYLLNAFKLHRPVPKLGMTEISRLNMHETFKMATSVVDNIQTAWKKGNIIGKLNILGQYAPTWAKTEGTGRQGKPTFHQHPWIGEETWLVAHVAQIKPTTGLGPHAILCPSTPPLLLSRTASSPVSSIFKNPLHLVVVRPLWVSLFPTMPVLWVFPLFSTDISHVFKIKPFPRHCQLCFYFYMPMHRKKTLICGVQYKQLQKCA